MFMNLLIFRISQLSPLVVFKRSILAAKGGTTWARNEFCLKMTDFHVTFKDLLHAVNLLHGTDGFTSPPKEGALRIFFRPENSNGFGRV